MTRIVATNGPNDDRRPMMMTDYTRSFVLYCNNFTDEIGNCAA